MSRRFPHLGGGRSACVTAATLLIMLMLPEPARAADPPPAARAWALRIDAPGQADVFVLADVSAIAGTQPSATGAPLVLAGQDAPDRAVADSEVPGDDTAFHTYDDPTASLSAELGFAHAAVTTGSATAAAGFEASTGTGFSLANELFTFEQQEQMLNQWTEVQEQITGPVNEALATLGSALEPAGLTIPRIEGIQAIGLVDAMRSEHVASKASVASSPGFSSARASTTLRSLSLFGGFLVVEDVAARAVSDSVAGADTREAVATVGRLHLAGIQVVGDGHGLRVAGNDLVSRTVVQPAMDALLTVLAQSGVTIRVADEHASGVRRDAAALEVAVATPQGIGRISVAYAEASAPTVAAAGSAIPVGGPAAPPPPNQPTFDTRISPGGPAFTDPGPVIPGTPGQTIVRGPIDRRLGEDVARMLKLVFLMFVVGALAGTGVIPVVARRARSTIPKEVVPS